MNKRIVKFLDILASIIIFPLRIPEFAFKFGYVLRMWMKKKV